MSAKKNVAEKEEKDNKVGSFYNLKKEELTQAILDSFNESQSKGKPIWELPVLNNSYMNPSTGVVYSPMNAAYLEKQLNVRRFNLQMNEFKKHPVILEEVQKIINDPLKIFGSDLGIINQVRVAANDNVKLKNAIAKADENLGTIEISPYFMTMNQLKNVYTNAGSRAYYFLQVFPVDLFGKNKQEKDKDLSKENEVEKDLEKGIFDEEDTDVKKIGSRMVRKAYSAFNYSDLKVIEGLEEPEGYKRRMQAFEKEVSPEEVKTLIKAITKISPYPVMRITTSRSSAFFDGQTVNVAPTEFFKSDIVELHTLAHEIIHAYGGAAEVGMKEYKKYGRDCFKTYSSNKKSEAEEELIANVGATMVLNMFNVKSSEEERFEAFNKNHEVYDHGWAKNLKEDPKIVLRAMNMAEKVAKNISFRIKKELELIYEKNPDTPLPPFIKNELESKRKIRNLDKDIQSDFVPKVKDQTLDTKKLYSNNRPPRRPKI